MPRWISNFLFWCIFKLLLLKHVNKFLSNNQNKQGMDFIESFFDYLNFSYLLSDKDYQRIPSEGRLIIVANHPLGALDGLALIKSIHRVRQDVKVVVNDVLMKVANISEFLIPFDVFAETLNKESFVRMRNALQNEEVIIFFPAAEVSRLSPKGVKDGCWKKGAVQLALKYNVPILPVFIKGKNSRLFYWISFFFKNMSTLLLPREMFHKRNKNIQIKIGDPIPVHVLKSSCLGIDELTKLLKKHVYRLSRNRTSLFKTEKNIVHPTSKKQLKAELSRAELLGETNDGKRIYLVNYAQAKNTIREIGRLRELTFRKVGEGTGHQLDTDEFDKYYKHIVLWDEDDLEIVGAYRIGYCSEILANKYSLYTEELFDFSPAFRKLLPDSIELGRSFIQYRYWKGNALDYLWRGIGLFLKRHPEIKYMFGAVSISDNYSTDAKNLIIQFYRKWYSYPETLAEGKKPYVITRKQEDEVNVILNEDSRDEDYRHLRSSLKNLGYAIPILFKQYVRLCDHGGIHILDFNIDEDFSNTVDGLVLLNMKYLSQKACQRYLE
ncbi:MAG: lysophospholipid acyltransferase family protein [Candidatus Cloacimonetes bacterium]|nr:lysophospholipid acyltransferase family protein [Candidatus Cloacimonadota bacterium]